MKILNVGSFNIDYVYTVPHFITAKETMASISRDIFSGGKGLNQSVALAKAGAEVYHYGAIGKADGGELKSILSSSGVRMDYLKERDICSGHTIIQVDASGQNAILLYGGANQTLDSAELDAVLEGFEEGDYMVLQNEVNLTQEAMIKGAQKGMYIVLNPSPMNEKVLSLSLEKVNCFILNEVEAQALSDCETEPEKQLEELSKRFPLADIVLTLGELGVIYREHGMSKTIRCPARVVNAVDTTAAGDTFLGYFIALTADNSDPMSALKKAAAASSICVSRAGAVTSIPGMAEVEEIEFLKI